ncbi:MAG: sn-glycerol-3-phosphate ABC transporter ATP-binding protein UgpC [Candidatus Marinimicrobia bacterium]|nr:sn-glycerol-3-phosphate ABC transporter ATP-binding protein UgpC [Candidatus Neomarinimicrobiota bacterium]
MAQIVLKNIDKTFDERRKVIDNLNLTIRDGEFLVLVGPSGCGKSTTLRLIAGLESATAGDIFIGETLVNHIPPKDRDISMVFQNYALYPHMTVHDNIAFGLKLRKYPKEEIEQRVQEAADILEIHSLLKRKPKQLSGGQRQRVALGRAIVRKPKVFLFDEPLSNLDAKLRVQMRAEIKKLHRQLKITMVYVTHDQIEAMTMGDRIAIMKDGIIHQLDTPMEIYQKPADLFVAGFIGSPSMNFIPAVITENKTLYSKDMDLVFDFPESCNAVLKKEAQKAVIVGIRPEHLYITPPDKKAVPLQTRLDLIEPLGNETILYMTRNEIRLHCITGAFDPLMEELSHMDLYPDMSKAHLFDAETGKRL